MTVPPDIHEWISFDEVDEQRTWVFDATYLRSNYTCIFGCGCKGIRDEPAPELGLGCCNFGAHFVDDADIANLEEHVARLEPRHMQFYDKAMKPPKKADSRADGKNGGKNGAGQHRNGYLRAGDPDGDGNPTTITRLVAHQGVDACIFLNRPGFEGGAGCALHITTLEVGERPMDWKPSVCWQVPIRLEHSTDESGHLTSRLREWKRRDWGEGGSDFGWWCTEEPDAFVGAEPLYKSAKDDIIELIGPRVYDQMVVLLERPEWVPVPHPVLRRS